MTFEKWERFAEPIMTALSAVFLVLYAVTVLAEPYGLVDTTLHILMYAMIAVFALDYVVKLVLVPSSNKGRWVLNHLFDVLIIVIPMYRLVRLVPRLSNTRVFREVFKENGSQGFRARIVTYTVVISLLTLFVGSLALLNAERDAPLSQINTFAKALWCVWVSTTSVGYGDVTPVSGLGRLVAGILMFAGIILNGIICALLSSWLIQEESIRKNREDRLSKERIAKINGRVDEMSKGLAEITKTLGQIAEATVPRDEDDEDEEDEDEDEYDEEEDDEEDEEDEDATQPKDEPVPVEEQVAEQMVRDSIREAQSQYDAQGVTDEPDPDSGYIQMASPRPRPRAAARDPKANRLTGEKPPSTFRKNPDPTMTGRIPPVRKD